MVLCNDLYDTKVDLEYFMSSDEPQWTMFISAGAIKCQGSMVSSITCDKSLIIHSVVGCIDLTTYS